MTLDPETLFELDRRGVNRSAITDKLIRRFCKAMGCESVRLAKYFTPKECACLLDAFTPSPMWPGEPELVPMFFEQQCLSRGLATKYGCQGKALMNKLTALDLLGRLTLIDAIECWHKAASVKKPDGVNPFALEEMTA